MIKIKRGLYISVIVLACICLSGCSTRELEERSFPLAIGLDKAGSGCRVDFYFPQLSEVADENAKSKNEDAFRVTADSYYEAWQTYEADSENSLDYNHLKVLVLGMDFLEDEDALADFLEFAISQENFSRNTLVFAANPNASKILALNDGLDKPIGTFLEEMAANSTLYKARTMPTLGDLYNENYNRNTIIFLPILDNNGGMPVISEYCVLRNFRPVGTLSMQEALEGLLIQNKLKEFSMKLDEGKILKLNAPECSYEITEKRGKPQVSLAVKSEAVWMNGKYADTEERETMQQEANKKITEMLQETLYGARDEKGVDLTGSYEKLGGYDRELYQSYVDKKDQYDAILEYTVKTDITLVDTK